MKNVLDCVHVAQVLFGLHLKASDLTLHVIVQTNVEIQCDRDLQQSMLSVHQEMQLEE